MSRALATGSRSRTRSGALTERVEDADLRQPMPRPLPPLASSRMPRVLVVTNRLPYPTNDGWKLRAYHVIKAMAQGADVTLVTFHDEDVALLEEFGESLPRSVEVRAVPPPNRNSPLRLLLGLVTRTPIYVWNERSAKMRALIRSLVAEKEFDAGVVELAHLYPYLSELPKGARRVIDTHNIDSLVLERYAKSLSGPRAVYARLTARKLARQEREFFEDADLVWVCSEPEAQRLVPMVPRANVQVVPNGVDALGTRPASEVRTGARIVFCGHMGYYPNVDAVDYFVSDIMPRIRASVPAAEFWVVGMDPAPSVVAAGEANQWVHVTGSVESVTPYVEEAAVIAVPLRVGGGTRLKILEALASAKGVVSTSVGAEGLSVEHGKHLVLADDPDSFADAVVRMIQDPELASRLGRQGRRRVEDLYDWSSIGAQIRVGAGLKTEDAPS